MDDYYDARRSTKPTQPSHSHNKSTSAVSAPASTPAQSIQTTQSAQPPRQSTSFTPKFDVRESDKFFILDGELPGAQQENIEIEFTEHETIVIKGHIERNYNVASPADDNDEVMSVHSDGAMSTHSNYHSPTVEDEEDEEGAIKVITTTSKNRQISKHQPESQQPKYKYWASERSVGSFQRTFTFPSRVDQNGVKATYRNGILTILVPKQMAQKVKRIRID
jgi:HSP20 family molecular chaperone IbpA